MEVVASVCRDLRQDGAVCKEGSLVRGDHASEVSRKTEEIWQGEQHLGKRKKKLNLKIKDWKGRWRSDHEEPWAQF